MTKSHQQKNPHLAKSQLTKKGLRVRFKKPDCGFCFKRTCPQQDDQPPQI